jgi:hypothetical protein
VRTAPHDPGEDTVADIGNVNDDDGDRMAVSIRNTDLAVHEGQVRDRLRGE